MLLCDYHTHSNYSFDGDRLATIDAICKTAIERGITHLAITDHFESNSKYEDDFAPFNDEAAYLEIESAKEKYKGKLFLSAGLEIGQAHQYAEETNRILSKHKYDFVIASIHNLTSLRDFYYIDFNNLDIAEVKEFFSKYIDELYELVDKFDWIDTVGHITYIHRYAHLAGLKLDFEEFYPRLTNLFNKMISKGIALEVNTSSLYRGLGFTMPSSDILLHYYNCGGRLLTLGSDSHRTENLGRGIPEAIEIIKDIGFTHIMCVEDGKKTMIKI